jgi:hypothetical protein
MHGPLDVKLLHHAYIIIVTATHGIQLDHTNTEGLIMFCKIIYVYYENHTKHTDTICKQTSTVRMLKQAVHLTTSCFKRLKVT